MSEILPNRLFCFFCLMVFVSFDLNAKERDTIFTMSLAELMNIRVQTPSKTDEPIDKAPNVMYVVTKEQIQQRGYRNLQDLLVTIPGFNVFHRDLQFVGQVRGVAPNENEKITFMINGHNINQVTETEILNGPINLDNIERVEVIVGPGSVLYGPETLTSIVNLITKKDGQSGVVASVATNNKISATTQFGKKWDEKNYVNVSFTGMQQDGFTAFDPDTLPYRQGRVGQLNPGYFLYADARMDEWFMQYSSLNATMPLLSVYDDMKGMSAAGHRHDYLDKLILGNEQLLNDRVSLTVKGSYASKRMVRAQTIDAVDPVKYPESYDLNQKVYKGDVLLTHQTANNYLQIGGQFFYYQNRHNYVYKWQPRTLSVHPDSLSIMNQLVKPNDTYNAGIYVSDQYDITEKISVNAAIRLDYSTILEYTKIYPSPRLALIYSPFQEWTTKLMYNRSHRLPAPWMSTQNIKWNVQDDYIKNPLAERPEKLTAYEWQNIIYLFDHTRMSVNVYYQELEDYILWYRPFTNAGDMKGYGMEFSFRSMPSRFFSVWGNTGYNNSRFEIKANPIPATLAINESGEMLAVPRYTANLGVDASYRNLYVSPYVRYFNRQPAKQYPQDEVFYIYDRYYLNLAITYKNILLKDLHASLLLKNILNNREEVAAQAFNRTYRPLGFTAEIVLRYAF